MVTPSGAYWVRVRLEGAVVEYLIGSELVDIAQIADVQAVLKLDDGREWSLRVMTAEALTSEVAVWRSTALSDDIMSYSDLFVVSGPGLETMSGAIATAAANL